MPELDTGTAETLPRAKWFIHMRKHRVLVRAVWFAEQLGKFAIVVTLIQYVWEGPQRRKSKEYQAWQVINAATTGDGGRSLAIHDLIDDGVSLAGVTFHDAFFSHNDMRGADLDNTRFISNRFYDFDFSCRKTLIVTYLLHGDCVPTTFQNAVFQANSIEAVDFTHAGLADSEFSGTGLVNGRYHFDINSVNFTSAFLFRAYFHDIGINITDFDRADLRIAKFKNVGIFGSSFRNAYLGYGRESGTQFDNVQLVNTLFDGAILANVSFKDTYISNDGNGSTPGCSQFNNCNDIIERRLLSERDFPHALLCNTSFDGDISNRDCKDIRIHLGPMANMR